MPCADALLVFVAAALPTDLSPRPSGFHVKSRSIAPSRAGGAVAPARFAAKAVTWL